MDKESYQAITIGHVAKRGTKRAFFFIFGAESGSVERGDHFFFNEGFLERESSTSL